MLLVPLEADVTMYRWPIMNFVLIGTITLLSLLAFGAPEEAGIEAFVLQDWSVAGMIGHVFLHGGLLHLLGNMLFLWAFGNAVCAKLGNFTYLAVFFALAITSASVHLMFDGRPAIGASGAINGVVGLFLVYFPRNDIRCFWWFFFRFGTFHVSSIWMILLWLIFDLWGASGDSGSVAHFAHLGGFVAGVMIGFGSLVFNVVEMTDTECSLLEMMKGGR